MAGGLGDVPPQIQKRGVSCPISNPATSGTQNAGKPLAYEGGEKMYSATISSKYQIVIPRAVRKRLGLKPKQKVVFIPWGNTLRLVVIPPIEQAKGMFSGIDAEILREEDEER